MIIIKTVRNQNPILLVSCAIPLRPNRELSMAANVYRLTSFIYDLDFMRVMTATKVDLFPTAVA